MSKRIAPCFVFFFVLSVLYGQNAADSVSRLDSAVKTLAADIQKKIPAGESPKIALGQWNYQNSAPALGLYWAAQLTEELVNIPDRSFILISAGPNPSDWTVSGEIIETAGTIRVYTRLIRLSDHSIEASFHADFEFNEYIAEMLSGGRSGSSPSVIRDAYEPDSLENPLAVDIAAGSNGPVINRTLHNDNDEDFFLLTPDKDGTLVMETTGEDIDTYMELYDAGSRDSLTEDDDGGSDVNARIRYQVHAGNSYTAKVRAYDNDTGTYGFHAWLTEPVRMTPDEYENDNESDSAKEISLGTAQQHTFTTGDDVDWVKFQITQSGRYTIRAQGVNSTGLDTYIELYDDDYNSIDADDDGGQNLDSLLSVSLQAGTYYVKVECFDDEPDEPYTIRVDSGE
ncbi:MAG: PPC domain-containing protein [Treponema sp.]|jgi:hypothetical protein|nr:PPC domain-containing protein [Treponema sp.]